MSTDRVAAEIPHQILENFLKELTPNVPKEIIDRLRETLLEQGLLDELSVRIAIFGEEEIL